MRWLTALLVAVAAAFVSVPAIGEVVAAPPPLAAGDLTFGGYDRVAHLDVYEQPMTAVGYRDGAGSTVELPLSHTGDGPPVTVVAVEPFPELLGMVEVTAVDGLPLTLQPGDRATVRVRARFTNCRYYTERAVNHFLAAEVTVAGPRGPVTAQLTYPSEVVLRSPTILGCPDRVTDRSARQRLLAKDE